MTKYCIFVQNYTIPQNHLEGQTCVTYLHRYRFNSVMFTGQRPTGLDVCNTIALNLDLASIESAVQNSYKLITKVISLPSHPYS